MLGWRDADLFELLSAHLCAHRGCCTRLCAHLDLRAVPGSHDLGGLSGVLALPGESSLAPPLVGQGTGRRPTDRAGAGHHPAAVERAVDRLRGADFGTDAKGPAIRGGTRHQVAVRPSSISLDRTRQCLVGGARGHFRRAGPILAGFGLPPGFAARRERGRRVLSGRIGLAVWIRDHVVSALLFLARRRRHAGPRATSDSPRRGTQRAAVPAIERCHPRHRHRHQRDRLDAGDLDRCRVYDCLASLAGGVRRPGRALVACCPWAGPRSFGARR